MKCWRWILIALVALSLGCVLFPTTSSAAHRSAVSAWVEGAGPSDGGNSLMGDPDGGTGGPGINSGYLHDYRVAAQRPPQPSFWIWLRQYLASVSSWNWSAIGR